ncbi:MAG TPA: peptidyl-alpha-hydroxyglycine alpha-amidating lyase family protein [Thermomicrobiales bacterium]|jgi:DNA-binding beta-propeller fold protein YncE
MDTLRYEVIADWEQLPDGYTHLDVVGIAVDSRDRLFLLGRQQPRVLIYERDGTFVGSWGEGLFTERTHGLTIAPDDSVFIVDEGAEVVYKFTPTGELLLTLGNKGVASDTGYDGQSLASIVRGGPPFNRPTNVAVAPNGELYVSDGYGNARVHRFSAAGELLGSWGEPGNGPGQFNLSHGVAVAPDGRVFVADRENDRIQIFAPDGAYLTEWRQVQRPTNVAFGSDGRVYVSELWRRAGETSMLHGLIPDDHPGRASVLDLDGNILARWGGPGRCAPGSFVAPHDICVDSHGDVYVGEVAWTFGVKPGHVPAGCHALQKFRRIG